MPNDNDENVQSARLDAMMHIYFWLKFIKMFFIIITLCYYSGLLWVIYCEVASQRTNAEDDTYFFIEYDLKQRDDMDNLKLAMYYAWTSLSTVGFGDLYPQNSEERLLCSFIFLLIGVNCFAYISSSFIEIFY